MTTTAVRKIALTLKAYGLELHLWKEEAEREWGATRSDSNNAVSSIFGEDTLMLARFRFLGEARIRAICRSDDADLPGSDAFLDSWKPIILTKG